MLFFNTAVYIKFKLYAFDRVDFVTFVKKYIYSIFFHHDELYILNNVIKHYNKSVLGFRKITAS